MIQENNVLIHGIRQAITHTRLAAMMAAIIVSAALVAGVQTPTHALSLDLGKTVTQVTASLPIVNQVTPLITGTPTVVTTPVVAPIVAPAASQAVTTVAKPVVAQTTNPLTTSADNATPAQTASGTENIPTTGATAATGTKQAAATGLTTSQLSTPSTGTANLATALNQDEIAAAVSGTTSAPITYTSKALSEKTAGTIFYIGIAGIFLGGCILFALQPRMRAKIA